MKKLYAALLLLSCLTCVRAEEPDASGEQLPPPEKNEMKTTELQAQLVDLDGKVIAVVMNYVLRFEQVKEAQYRASCGYYGDGEGKLSSQYILIPEEGKEFFQELARKSGSGPASNQRVYLYVHGKRLEAVGTRYSKSKGEYSW